MKYVLKNQEMQTVDYETIHGIGIPGLVLMERASKAVADYAVQMIDHSKRILVISGIGNNGGDALACTRILLEQDYLVDYMIVGNLEKASDDLKLQLQILKNLGYFPLENPPFGLSHEIRPLPPSSFSNVLRTVSNLGFKQSAKICICFLTPSAFLKNCT